MRYVVYGTGMYEVCSLWYMVQVCMRYVVYGTSMYEVCSLWYRYV